MRTQDYEKRIPMIAFSEAVRKYRSDVGQFQAFATRVIKKPYIDSIREGVCQVTSISLDSCQEDQNHPNPTPDETQHQHLVEQPQIQSEDPIKLEIDALSEAVRPYGFCFMDVAKCSPKSEKIKMACKKVSVLLLRDPALLATMKENLELPVQQLEENPDVPKNIIARHRNYIVCLVEILSGEYVYMTKFVKIEKGSDQP